MNENGVMGSLGLALLALWLLGGCNEETDDKPCPAYGCVNSATLGGALQVGDTTRRIAASLCHAEGECIEADVDLQGLGGEPRCAAPTLGEGTFCVARSSVGALHVEATVFFGAGDDLRPSGERFTLTLTDSISGEVLLEETRTASFEVTREDACHLCWGATMSF
jgi:hypothetical protein